MTVTDVLVSAGMDADIGLSVIGSAYAGATFTAADDINITGDSLVVTADANQIGLISSVAFISASIAANATLDINAGTHNSTSDLNMNVGSTLVNAQAFGIASSAAVAYATANALFTAGNDININGGPVNVVADADAITDGGTNSAFAYAGMVMFAGTHGTGDLNVNVDVSATANANTNAYGSAGAVALVLENAANNINVTGTIIATANAVGSSGQAYGLGAVGLFAGSDINVTGDINANASADNNGSASAIAGVIMSDSGNISVSGGVNVNATAVNSFGPAGTGDANAYAFMVASASSIIDMGGVTVNADALCSGSTGSCNAFAGAAGLVVTGGDITLSGPITVQSFATDNNTGTTASATANLRIISSSGSVNVGPINVLASAFNDHGTSPQANALASGFVFAFNSNTVSDITITANADVGSGNSGLASGQGYLLVQTATGNAGNNNLNGALSVNVGLNGLSTTGYARLELDAAGSSGMNIAGPGFAVPHAEAGGASVTNVMSDIDTVNNATAELVIPHVIVTDNELTRRLVVTWLEASGFLLPTAFDSQSLGDGHERSGGPTGGQHVIRNGTRRSTILGLPNGNGFGGFSVDENGNIIFRASFGGLPDDAPLPPDLCVSTEREHLGGIMNCGWTDEPKFY
jgi:hypothetical protein